MSASRINPRQLEGLCSPPDASRTSGKRGGGADWLSRLSSRSSFARSRCPEALCGPVKARRAAVSAILASRRGPPFPSRAHGQSPARRRLWDVRRGHPSTRNRPQSAAERFRACDAEPASTQCAVLTYRQLRTRRSSSGASGPPSGDAERTFFAPIGDGLMEMPPLIRAMLSDVTASHAAVSAPDTSKRKRLDEVRRRLRSRLR